MYKEKWFHSPWIIGLLFALWFLIVPPLLAIFLIIQRSKEMKEAEQFWDDNDFSEIVDMKVEMNRLTEEKEQLVKMIDLNQNRLEEFKPFTDLIEVETKLKNSVTSLELQYDDLQKKLEVSQEDLLRLDEELLHQSFGFYDPKYGFDSSELYKEKLKEIQSKQKHMVKQKTATNHSLDWHISGDKKKGKEFILDTIKLSIRAFNNECENIISKVKYNNIEASEKRIHKLYTDINKLTDMQNVFITSQYLNLKIEELYLKYEFEQKKQEEKEEQLAIKEQMREEAKALKELEKAKEKVEKEESHFEKAIEKLKLQLSETEKNKQEKLMAKLKELEAQLEETRKNKEDVLYRVQHTRAGYVYIISNIGSFGEDVYKIGMTRRLEPMDRVKELGDASVPFRFDVHGMIFSDDAPGLENALHKAFSDKRVNKVNERKEFFKVRLEEIEEVVKKSHNKTVVFTKLAEAEEYRKSLQKDKALQGVS